MLKADVIALVVLATVCALRAEISNSQNYPSKPIRVLTTAPGGGGDNALRFIAPIVSLRLEQPVIVDNRANTANVGAEIVSHAAADGYTLIAYGSTIWIGPLMQPASYDPIRDFAPITMMTRSPGIVVIHPALAVKSVKELIELAKARPGVLNYGSGNAGSSSHLAMELFKSLSGVNIIRIPFKGVGPAVNALVGGEVQVMLATAAAAIPYTKSGRLTGLAVTSANPSPVAPGMVTVNESGLPGYEFTSGSGIWAPAKTPAAIIARLNREIAASLNQPDIKQRLLASGAETVGNTPKEFAENMKSEIVRMGKVIREAGIRVE
jgi:tripartite-type tricarboxylate transporter receptor subunit TctC